MATCNTCSKQQDQLYRCSICKRYAFCGDDCFYNHKGHAETCWDRFSTDPQYVAAKLDAVLDQVAEHDAFGLNDVDKGLELMESLMENRVEKVDEAHAFIADTYERVQLSLGGFTKGFTYTKLLATQRGRDKLLKKIKKLEQSGNLKELKRIQKIVRLANKNRFKRPATKHNMNELQEVVDEAVEQLE